MLKNQCLIESHRAKTNRIVIASIICLVAGILVVPIQSANRARMDTGENGETAAVETLIVGGDYDIRLFIENDVVWGAMQYGIQIYSPVGAMWSYSPDSYGYGTRQFVNVIPGTRMDPPKIIWDMTGLLVTEINIDGLLSDSLLIGGLAMQNGLPPGPYEPIMSISLNVTFLAESGPIGIICIDSSFIPPTGDYFSEADGTTYTITIDGPFCWPITYICPFDSDGYGDPGHLQNECPDDNCSSVYNPIKVILMEMGLGTCATAVPMLRMPGSRMLIAMV